MIPEGEAALGGITPLTSLHPGPAARQNSWKNPTPCMRRRQPQGPAGLYRFSLLSLPQQRAAELHSFSSPPPSPAPDFEAPGLNSAHYHRTHRGCWAGPECEKSMQPSLLIKGCPVGTGLKDPCWLSLWLSPLSLESMRPLRERHLGDTSGIWNGIENYLVDSFLFNLSACHPLPG